MGKPVIGTPQAFSGVEASNGEAFVSTPLDAAVMAAQVARLAADPARRARLGAAGRDYVLHNHTQEIVDERIQELYRRVLDRPAGALSDTLGNPRGLKRTTNDSIECWRAARTAATRRPCASGAARSWRVWAGCLAGGSRAAWCCEPAWAGRRAPCSASATSGCFTPVTCLGPRPEPGGGCQIMGLSWRGIVFGDRCTGGGSDDQSNQHLRGRARRRAQGRRQLQYRPLRLCRVFRLHRDRRSRPDGTSRHPPGREPRLRRRERRSSGGRHPDGHRHPRRLLARRRQCRPRRRSVGSGSAPPQGLW